MLEERYKERKKLEKKDDMEYNIYKRNKLA